MSLAGGTGYYPEGCLSLPDFLDSSWTAWDGLDGTDPAKNNNILGPDDSELRALVPGSLVQVIGHWILDL
jgi:hypothetical protein